MSRVHRSPIVIILGICLFSLMGTCVVQNAWQPVSYTTVPCPGPAWYVGPIPFTTHLATEIFTEAPKTLAFWSSESSHGPPSADWPPPLALHEALSNGILNQLPQHLAPSPCLGHVGPCLLLRQHLLAQPTGLCLLTQLTGFHRKNKRLIQGLSSWWPIWSIVSHFLTFSNKKADTCNQPPLRAWGILRF